MPLSPAINIHLAAALAAVAVGPVALWARKGATQRPRLHRAAGYAWVTLMLATALSALFIDTRLGPGWGGFGVIHLPIPVTLGGLALSFFYLARGLISGHRRVMQSLYLCACLLTGAFTLLPGRFLGQWLWSRLGLL